MPAYVAILTTNTPTIMVTAATWWQPPHPTHCNTPHHTLPIMAIISKKWKPNLHILTPDHWQRYLWYSPHHRNLCTKIQWQPLDWQWLIATENLQHPALQGISHNQLLSATSSTSSHWSGCATWKCLAVLLPEWWEEHFCQQTTPSASTQPHQQCLPNPHTSRQH